MPGRYKSQSDQWLINERKILDTLEKEPATFTELIEKVGLARSVVHTHLHALQKDSKIERVYQNGKILIKPTSRGLDPKEKIFTDLKLLIPTPIDELLEEGKPLLTPKVMKVTLDVLEGLPKKLGKILTFPLIRSLKPLEFVDASGRKVDYEPWPVRMWLLLAERTLDVFNIGIILTIYDYERNWIRESVEYLPDEEKAPGKVGFALTRMSENPSNLLALDRVRQQGQEKYFDTLLQWWKRVQDHIPGMTNLNYVVATLWLQYMEGCLSRKGR